MLNICKSCNDLRCGNHAACALRKLDQNPAVHQNERQADLAAKLATVPWYRQAAAFLFIVGRIETEVQYLLATGPAFLVQVTKSNPVLMTELRFMVGEEIVRALQVARVMQALGF